MTFTSEMAVTSVFPPGSASARAAGQAQIGAAPAAHVLTGGDDLRRAGRGVEPLEDDLAPVGRGDRADLDGHRPARGLVVEPAADRRAGQAAGDLSGSVRKLHTCSGVERTTKVLTISRAIMLSAVSADEKARWGGEELLAAARVAEEVGRGPGAPRGGARWRPRPSCRRPGRPRGSARASAGGRGVAAAARRSWTISARMLSATSSGRRAPRSSPAGIVTAISGSRDTPRSSEASRISAKRRAARDHAEVGGPRARAPRRRLSSSFSPIVATTAKRSAAPRRGRTRVARHAPRRSG